MSLSKTAAAPTGPIPPTTSRISAVGAATADEQVLRKSHIVTSEDMTQRLQRKQNLEPPNEPNLPEVGDYIQWRAKQSLLMVSNEEWTIGRVVSVSNKSIEVMVFDDSPLQYTTYVDMTVNDWEEIGGMYMSAHHL